MKKKYLLLAIFLFLFFPKDAYADTIVNSAPKTISYWNDTSNAITGPVSTYNLYNTWFYGYDFGTNDTKVGLSFNYDTSTLMQQANRVGTVNFVIYNSRLESYMFNPFRVYIKDYDNNITTCNVQATKYDLNDSKVLGSFAPVICPNAYISGPFSVYIADTLSSVGGKTAISNLTYKLSDDSSSIVNSIEQNTEQQKKTTEAVKEQTEATKKQTETIKDSDTSGSKDSASGFFSGFESDDYGLSDIIIMPLDFIKGLSSSKCSNLHLPLPLVNKTVELPCMTSIYSQYFGPFLTLYQTISTGIIAYWCCVNILKLVQGFKNPDSDEIEVMDL